MAIYLGGTLPSRSSHLPGETGPVYAPLHGVAPDRVYSSALSPGRRVVSYTAFPPLPRGARRFVSVALVLMSPSAGVTRYPCPVEPGLSSRTAFRLMPAAIRKTRDLNCFGGSGCPDRASLPSVDHSSGLSQLCQTFCTSSLSSNTSSIFCMFFRSPSAVRVT